MQLLKYPIFKIAVLNWMLSGTQYHLINHSQRRTLALVPVFGHVKVSVNFKSRGLVARKGFVRAHLLGCGNLLGTHLYSCYTHLSTSSYIPTQVCLNRFCVHSSPCCTLSRTASCKQNDTLLNAHHWLLDTAILQFSWLGATVRAEKSKV